LCRYPRPAFASRLPNRKRRCAEERRRRRIRRRRRKVEGG
jgi:hypothetical protein